MGLPADDLCLENAVVLERFSHRFPLVVDPAGQATRFLLNKYKVRRRPYNKGALRFLKARSKRTADLREV